MHKLVEKTIGNLFDETWKSLKIEFNQIVRNRILEFEVEEFTKNYFTKTIIHRTEPVKLLDFYQPLFIRKYGHKYADERIETTECKKLFDQNNFITLIGTAGSGKSTIIKYLLVNSILDNYKIPIKIELRYLNNYKENLFYYVKEEIFKLSQLAFDESIINRLLKSGNFLFFFDGYDELSSGVKDEITKNINDFTSLFNKNTYVITSRPYTNIELLSKFKNYEVCQLGEKEIEAFVYKQIPESEKEIAEKIISAIKDSENSYATFLSNPLLLSMFILTFQTYSNIPPKKSTFYRQVFDSLFYLHDSVSKLSWSREKKSGLIKEQFEYILQLFSFISFFKEVFVFEQSFLINTLNQIKEKKSSLKFENTLLIEDLQVAICILYKEGLDYVFPHRSMQEYFATTYIVNLDDKNKIAVYKKILDQLFNEQNYNIFSRDNFYSLLAEQDYLDINKYLIIPFLETFLENIKNDKYNEEKDGELMKIMINYYISFSKSNEFIETINTIFRSYITKTKDIRMKNVIKSSSKQVELSIEDSTFLKNEYEILIKGLKTTIPKVLKNLKKHIENETKSDSSIIDLI